MNKFKSDIKKIKYFVSIIKQYKERSKTSLRTIRDCFYVIYTGKASKFGRKERAFDGYNLF